MVVIFLLSIVPDSSWNISMDLFAPMIGIYLGVVVALHFADKYTSIFETPWQKLKSHNESLDFGVGGIENS